MTPLDDHELLLWPTRAGLTRTEVRQTVRRGLDTGDLSWPGANETAADRLGRIYVDMEVIQVVGEWGIRRWNSLSGQRC